MIIISLMEEESKGRSNTRTEPFEPSLITNVSRYPVLYERLPNYISVPWPVSPSVCERICIYIQIMCLYLCIYLLVSFLLADVKTLFFCVWQFCFCHWSYSTLFVTTLWKGLPSEWLLKRLINTWRTKAVCLITCKKNISLTINENIFLGITLVISNKGIFCPVIVDCIIHLHQWIDYSSTKVGEGGNWKGQGRHSIMVTYFSFKNGSSNMHNL